MKSLGGKDGNEEKRYLLEEVAIGVYTFCLFACMHSMGF